MHIACLRKTWALLDFEWLRLRKGRHSQLDRFHFFRYFVILCLICEWLLYILFLCFFLFGSSGSFNVHCLRNLNAKAPCQNYSYSRQIYGTKQKVMLRSNANNIIFRRKHLKYFHCLVQVLFCSCFLFHRRICTLEMYSQNGSCWKGPQWGHLVQPPCASQEIFILENS